LPFRWRLLEGLQANVVKLMVVYGVYEAFPVGCAVMIISVIAEEEALCSV